MLSLSPIKILVVIAVALLLLGPDKLPEVAHKLGSTWRALKRLQEKVESEVREVIPDLPSSGEIARIVRSPVNMLNQLADMADARDIKPYKIDSDELASEQAGDEPLDVGTSGLRTHEKPEMPTVVRKDYAPQSPDPSLN